MERGFADLDAGHDRCVTPGVRHDARATAWHGWFQRPRAAPRTWHPSFSRRGSPDHLIGLEEEGRGDGEAEGLGGLEINNQLGLRRPLNR